MQGKTYQSHLGLKSVGLRNGKFLQTNLRAEEEEALLLMQILIILQKLFYYMRLLLL